MTHAFIQTICIWPCVAAAAVAADYYVQQQVASCQVPEYFEIMELRIDFDFGVELPSSVRRRDTKYIYDNGQS